MTKWCPQHGYPLPCDKCGEGEYEEGFNAGQESRCDWHKPLPEIISESFIAGKKAGVEEGKKYKQPVYDFARAAYLRGIKEVVEWVEAHTHNIEEWTGWQEQKEDWGL